MAVHRIKSRQSALAPFAVQLADAVAQFINCRGQLFMLRRHRGDLRLNFFRFFFGAQIHAAEVFTLAPQFFKLVFHRVDIGKRLFNIMARHRQRFFWLNAQSFANPLSRFFETQFIGFHCGFQTRLRFACRANQGLNIARFRIGLR